MRKQVTNFAITALALLIYPLSLSSQNSFSLSLDTNGTPGNQAVTSLNTSPDQVVSIQIFGTNIQNARSLSARFEYDESQVVYEGFDAGDVLPSAQVLPEQGTNPTYVEIGMGALGGQATVNNGWVGTVRFRTTATFSGTAIWLVRGVIGRSGQLETVTLAAHVELQPGSVAPSPDFDGDGVVGIPDFLLFVDHFGSSRGDGTYQERYDLDGNDVIGIPDFLIFIDNFGKEVPTTGGGGGGGGGGSPDLIVESPSVSDEILSPGQSFTLRATVRNQGNGQSAATTLRYYSSTNSTITTSDTSVGTDAVESLSASGTSSESISLQAPNTPGSYYYGACVESVSRESDTENNCSTGVRVTVEGGNTFDATVAQIKNLKAELEQIEQEISKKRDNHRLSGPKDQFESDEQYAFRLNQLDSIEAKARRELRERYKFKDKQAQIGQLYRRVFRTNDITVTLDTYNANEEYFPITFEVTLNGESQSYNKRLEMNRDDARSLFNNWDRVTKTGYLSIDPGYRQALALVKLKNPIGQQEFTIEFDEIYDLTSGKRIAAFSLDGKYLATNSSLWTTVFRVSDGQSLWTTNRSFIGSYTPHRKGLAFSPDGQYLAQGTGGGASLLKVSNGEWVRRIAPGNSRSNYDHIAFSSDGRYLATARGIWEVSSGQRAQKVREFDFFPAITFSPDGQYLAFKANSNLFLWEVNRDTLVWENTDSINRSILSITFRPDGQYLASGHNGGKVTIRRVSNGKIVQQIEDLDTYTYVAFSPDGQHLAVMAYYGRRRGINIYRIPASITLTTSVTAERYIISGGSSTNCAWSPYGNLISDGNKVYRTLLQPDFQGD